MRYFCIFYESSPPGPLNKRLNMLSYKIHFRGEIRILSWKNSTPRSVSQRGVAYFANISAKINLLAIQF